MQYIVIFSPELLTAPLRCGRTPGAHCRGGEGVVRGIVGFSEASQASTHKMLVVPPWLCPKLFPDMARYSLGTPGRTSDTKLSQTGLFNKMHLCKSIFFQSILVDLSAMKNNDVRYFIYFGGI